MATQSAEAVSETDLESIFSDTTSQASTFSNPTALLLHQPRPQRIPSFDLHELSNASSSTSSLSPTAAAFQRSRSPLAPSARPNFLSVPNAASSSPSESRRERHRRKREERGTLASDRFDSPLRRYVRNMASLGAQQWTLPVGVGSVLLVKWLVGMGGYSGKGKLPMYGDFEAQRHWMELTSHVPIKQWYHYGPEWWQLDYPPLSAYHSWLLGKIGSHLLPTSFALDTSRGNSAPELEMFMRISVIATELAAWFPVVLLWCWSELASRSRRSQTIAALIVLGHPALILIDNGHFQHNSLMLALTLLAVLLFKRNHDLLGCIAFSASLGFKQMALYYAPAIGAYLVGKCIWLNGQSSGRTSLGLGVLDHFAKLGIVTATTFLVILAPFLQPFPSLIQHVGIRIFPLARGIFEDKVANVWCASNVVIKWKKIFEAAGMAKLAMAATLLAILPTAGILTWTSFSMRLTPTSSSLRRAPPTASLLPLALLASSLSFFLFSFQVHEKSILLPLMPMLLLMARRGGEGRSAGAVDAARSRSEEDWEVGCLFGNVATLSMFPLLLKDGQGQQYVVMTLLWNYMVGYNPLGVGTRWVRQLGLLTYPFILLVHLLQLTISPPARYPDLYPVLNVLLSCSVFGCVWLWANKRLVEEGWAMGAGAGAGAGLHHGETKAPPGSAGVSPVVNGKRKVL